MLKKLVLSLKSLVLRHEKKAGFIRLPNLVSRLDKGQPNQDRDDQVDRGQDQGPPVIVSDQIRADDRGHDIRHRSLDPIDPAQLGRQISQGNMAKGARVKGKKQTGFKMIGSP